MENKEKIEWMCYNCKNMNAIDSAQIRSAEEKGLKPILICGTCGYVSHPPREANLFKKENAQWITCTPFTGGEVRIPSGVGPEGWIPAFGGTPISREKYILTYGVDPEINWRYQKSM